MLEKCKICNGSRKILLLFSEVDCECVTLTPKHNIVCIWDLKEGEIGYETPASKIPYLLRLKDKFCYFSGIDDHYNWDCFDDIFDKSTIFHKWPPNIDLMGNDEFSKNLIVIATSITNKDKAFEAIKFHEHNLNKL